MTPVASIETNITIVEPIGTNITISDPLIHTTLVLKQWNINMHDLMCTQPPVHYTYKMTYSPRPLILHRRLHAIDAVKTVIIHRPICIIYDSTT